MSGILIATLLLAGAQAGGRVEVPFRLGEDAIVVDAEVNGKKVSLMFDTGFGGSVVLNDTINIGKPTGKMVLRDFVGELEVPTVKVTSLKIGAQTIDPTGMEAVLTPSANYSMSYNTHVDGIMGFEVIKHNITEINFQGQKFIFHPSSVDVTKRTPDGAKTFLNRLLPTGHNSLEMSVQTDAGERMILALDTGNAFFATTHRDVLERVGLWKPGAEAKFMRSSMVASGEVPSWDILMKNVTIFGVKVPESVWSIIDLPSSSAEGDGTIGFGFLKNFNITIDYERRRVWLENFTGEVGNQPVADIGITAGFDPRAGRVRVYRVAPASPADKAGIKVGDAVLSIDEVSELNVGYRRLAKMMEGPLGSKVKLALSRGGNLMRLEVERAYLVNGY
ncbi:MAG: PDZ domain-containing protein [Fimbriimonadaceae bacterium]|nr:hypothetical protein [Fimbriimonadaceae bacterium]MCL4284759.1 PDZ domain-containing protein [Fimbriimonadaceae bacterium]MCZ7580812.1 PDZ domain-containing protein [Fimbriimonadaceae bacterium]QOJ12530.1 MAG: PDZ domain-containing protein [Chthonomonadaceae bacterium]